MLSPALASAADALLAAGTPTPFFLYDLPTVRARCDALRAAFPDASLLYAIKANSNAHIVRSVIASGFGIEAVSLGEVLLARALGAQRILYSPNNASDDEFAAVSALAAAAAGDAAATAPCAITLNCDSESRLLAVPPGAAVCLRVNGGVGGGHHAHVVTCGERSKFGVDVAALAAVLAGAAARGVRIVGLHQHIGSGICDPSVYTAAAGVLFAAAEAHAPALRDLAFLDVGGGLGVAYRAAGEATLEPAALAALLLPRFARAAAVLPAGLRLVLEPGRFLVAECGALVARVTCVKRSAAGLRRAGTDTGFNHLCRPMVYGAYHAISILPRAGGAAADAAATDDGVLVVGNICESGDCFTPDGPRAELAGVREGDALAIHTAGAYGVAMSSEYNVRPRPAEFVADTLANVAALVGAAAPAAPRAAAAASVSALLARPGPAIATADGSRAVLCSTRARSISSMVDEIVSGGFPARA